MRGVAVFLTGIFAISAVVLVMGVLLEPITAVVVDSGAVQSLGWASDAKSIRDTILRWIPLLGIGFFLTWAGMWALRRERTTTRRR
jgi:preprotein translocase subunit SecG